MGSDEEVTLAEGRIRLEDPAAAEALAQRLADKGIPARVVDRDDTAASVLLPAGTPATLLQDEHIPVDAAAPCAQCGQVTSPSRPRCKHCDAIIPWVRQPEDMPRTKPWANSVPGTGCGIVVVVLVVALVGALMLFGSGDDDGAAPPTPPATLPATPPAAPIIQSGMSTTATCMAFLEIVSDFTLDDEVLARAFEGLATRTEDQGLALELLEVAAAFRRGDREISSVGVMRYC